MSNILYNIRKNLANMNLINSEEFINEPNIEDTCYICNQRIETSVCPNCKIDFNNIFVCPLLNDEEHIKGNKICNVSNKQCTLKGIEFESCDNYHNIDI